MRTYQNQIVPLIIIFLGVAVWLGGNIINDKQNGMNLALTLVGIGGGRLTRHHANEDSGTIVDKIEKVTVERPPLDK
jgi:hypothetical protein